MGSIIASCCGLNNSSQVEVENEVLIDPNDRKRISEFDYLNSYLALQDPSLLESAYRHLLSFKDFKGVKQVSDIH